MQDFALSVAVELRAPITEQIRTAEQAACLIRSRLRQRFTMAGLSALLLLERAGEAGEFDAATASFFSWAATENLLAFRSDHEKPSHQATTKSMPRA